MKKLLLLAFLFFPLPVSAQVQTYKYQASCFLDDPELALEDVCTVVETRESNGSLRTRNIYSNKFSLTIKSWWDARQGKFIKWDSYNKFEYVWNYRVAPFGYTFVMPGFAVHDVSWD